MLWKARKGKGSKSDDSSETTDSSEQAPKTKKQKTSDERGHTWTYGDQLKTAGGAIVLAAMLLCGPAALVVHGLAPEAVAEVSDDRAPGLSAEQQRAAGVATEYVGAWLNATEENYERLEAFGASLPTSLPLKPVPYSDLQLVSAEAQDDEGTQLLVTVSALVEEVDEEGTKSRVPRHYSVPMYLSGDQAQPISLPAPVTASTAPERAFSPDYGRDTAAAVHDTITQFFRAYLAGEGEIDRILTPDTPIEPISPAPYTAVTISELTAVEDVPENPGDGETAELLATITAKTGTDNVGATATYTLTITARDGRWEVSDLNSYPALSETTDASATPDPSETESPDTEE